MTGLMRRLRTEEGFGLVELMISLVVLNVGILAIVAGFNGGSLALLRASETSTASTLGDKQMELYRAITYAAISLNTTAVDGTYTADAAYPGHARDGRHAPRRCAAACIPTQTRSTPAARHRAPTGARTGSTRTSSLQTPAERGRALKRVTVVVRRSSPLKTLARVSSNFDQSTG